ncbi:MAG: hypothetical protein IPK80_06425 [Nannocystis sp.]|nr:hypothetical protein [Nannocystis sp.]
MSWIVFLFLVCYGSVRACLSVRGLLRYTRLRRQLPARPGPLALPGHLSLGLSHLIEEAHAARARMIDAARSIGAVLILDPDVPLGVVRDYRYRMAVLNAWSAATQCLRSREGLDERERVRLDDIGCTFDRFEQTLSSLDVAFHQAKRARPFEPFAVEQVRATYSRVAAMAYELELLESRLGVSPSDPYRA